MEKKELLPILTYPNEILSRVSTPIEQITPEIKELAQKMVTTMYEKRGIGLAAPQVGHNIRLITVDISGPDERKDLIILLNPTIVESSGQIEMEEGCLSVVGYQAKVKRAAKIKVEAIDLQGEKICLQAEELFAVCLQHEIDHLDGILFIDRISKLKRRLYEQRLQKWMKKRKK